VIDRNVLEWRLDPSSPHRLPIATGADVRLIIAATRATARAWPPRRCTSWGCVPPPIWSADSKPGALGRRPDDLSSQPVEPSAVAPGPGGS
jgi:hypothetical protein